MGTSTDLYQRTESSIERIWHKVEALARSKISRKECDDVTFQASSVANDVCDQIINSSKTRDRRILGDLLNKSLSLAKMNIAKALKRNIVIRDRRISADIEDQITVVDMEEITDGISQQDKIFLDTLHKTGSIQKAADAIRVSVTTAKRMKRRLLLAIKENVKRG